ncbi:MAG: hypothetical protein QM647_01935 [Asticcacaulis sp.]|uniref:hypothetical protein n=1 Tax=Asticcacaulis sp. TaxID=1872648 RepID=UPI0039E29132
MRISDLQTPARLYAVTESESLYGGRSFSLAPGMTVWGDFQPDTPEVESMAEGDAFVVQGADFICRSAAGLARGGRLSLKGFDWTIISLDEGADGYVRARLERIHV